MRVTWKVPSGGVFLGQPGGQEGPRRAECPLGIKDGWRLPQAWKEDWGPHSREPLSPRRPGRGQERAQTPSPSAGPPAGRGPPAQRHPPSEPREAQSRGGNRTRIRNAFSFSLQLTPSLGAGESRSCGACPGLAAAAHSPGSGSSRAPPSHPVPCLACCSWAGPVTSPRHRAVIHKMG